MKHFTILKYGMPALILASFTSAIYAQKSKVENTDRPIKGVYKTADDYAKGNLSTDYNRLAFCYKLYTDVFITSTTPVTYNKYGNPEVEKGQGVAINSGDFYAYTDNEGFTFRLVKRTTHINVIYRVLAAGKIYLYSDESYAQFKTDGNGKIVSVNWLITNDGDYYNNDGGLKHGYTEFRRVFYISGDPASLPIMCDEDNLTKLLGSDKAGEIKKVDLASHKSKNFGDILGTVLGWITDYNTAHK